MRPESEGQIFHAKLNGHVASRHPAGPWTDRILVTKYQPSALVEK
jgi:hypothetical protein